MLLNARRREVVRSKKENLPKVTLTDFFVKAIALALNGTKEVNRLWRNGEIKQLTERNVGLVIGLDEGVVIAIIENADKLSLTEIAEHRINMVTEIRAGKFVPSPKECVISLSNLGTTRVDEFSAIIPPTQSSVLAIGRAAQRPYVSNGQLQVCNTIKTTLAIDHRAMDGLHGGALRQLPAGR